MPGVDAVLGHHHDLASEIDKLLIRWQNETAVHHRHAKRGNESRSKGYHENRLGLMTTCRLALGRWWGRITRTIEPNPTGAVNGSLLNPADQGVTLGIALAI